jgi:hypothetical protein
MDETDLRLDGNAAAGLLSELFAADVTTAVLVCASCGSDGPLGGAHVYSQGPGMVIRCTACSAALMRVARLRDRTVADLRGVGLLSTWSTQPPTP